MVFDRDQSRQLIDALTADQRGKAATAALARFAVLAQHQRAVAFLPASAPLLRDALDYATARAQGVARSEGSELYDRFRQLLGPEDEPYDEPEDAGVLLVDLADLADYTVRVWDRPDDSAELLLGVHLHAYSLAAFLEDDDVSPAPQPLADLEYQRQGADLAVVAAGSMDLAALVDASAELRQAYSARFLEILSKDDQTNPAHSD